MKIENINKALSLKEEYMGIEKILNLLDEPSPIRRLIVFARAEKNNIEDAETINIEDKSEFYKDMVSTLQQQLDDIRKEIELL